MHIAPTFTKLLMQANCLERLFRSLHQIQPGVEHFAEIRYLLLDNHKNVQNLSVRK